MKRAKTTRIESFWIVTKPNVNWHLKQLQSTVADVCMKISIAEFAGGLVPSDVVAAYLDETEAKREAAGMLEAIEKTLGAVLKAKPAHA